MAEARSNIITPPCEHYDECGGCSMQHYDIEEYYSLKNSMVTEVSSAHGGQILPLVRIGERSRRRVDFKISVSKDVINVGFFKHKTNDIVNINDCLVTDKSIVVTIPYIKDIIRTFKKPGKLSSASVTMLGDGFDVILRSKAEVKFDEEALKKISQEANFRRFYIQIADLEPVKIIDDENSFINILGKQVDVPLGSFLQATEQGQNSIIDFILNNLEGCNDIADLYCGIGTYTIPLLMKGHKVSAYEGDELMVSSLVNNVKKLDLNGLRLAEVRDLFKKPVSPEDIGHFDAVVINPPRTGAMQQVKRIAKSNLKKLIYISCSKKTFETDLKELEKSSFKLVKIQGIDQFFWSKHIELAAVIER